MRHTVSVLFLCVCCVDAVSVRRLCCVCAVSVRCPCAHAGAHVGADRCLQPDGVPDPRLFDCDCAVHVLWLCGCAVTDRCLQPDGTCAQFTVRIFYILYLLNIYFIFYICYIYILGPVSSIPLFEQFTFGMNFHKV